MPKSDDFNLVVSIDGESATIRIPSTGATKVDFPPITVKPGGNAYGVPYARLIARGAGTWTFTEADRAAK